jgi:hypothetical protein
MAQNRLFRPCDHIRRRRERSLNICGKAQAPELRQGSCSGSSRGVTCATDADRFQSLVRAMGRGVQRLCGRHRDPRSPSAPVVTIRKTMRRPHQGDVAQPAAGRAPPTSRARGSRNSLSQFFMSPGSLPRWSDIGDTWCCGTLPQGQLVRRSEKATIEKRRQFSTESLVQPRHSDAADGFVPSSSDRDAVSGPELAPASQNCGHSDGETLSSPEKCGHTSSSRLSSHNLGMFRRRAK